jgi:circadian clock protein KaiC
MLVRLIDVLKMQQITTLFTNLTLNDAPAETTDVGVSSLMDSWLLLKDSQHGVVRDRELYILKSRGMAHSNLRHRFLLTDHGVELMQPPVKSTREKGVSL